MSDQRDKHYEEVYGQDHPRGDAHGWIQWKGTDACVDLHCKCGALLHYDGDFLYYFECPHCQRMFALGQNIKLIELTDSQRKYAEKEHGVVIKHPDLDPGPPPPL